MKKIGTLKFGFGQAYYDWYKSHDHFLMVRYYLGAKIYYHNLFLSVSVFDESGELQRNIEQLLEDVKLLVNSSEEAHVVKDRETVIGFANKHESALRDHANDPSFTMTNYLDSAGPRTHVVTYGGGSFLNVKTKELLKYEMGDVLLFDKSDFGCKFISQVDERVTHHIITCWSTSDEAKKNWELFADFERARGHKGFRD